MTATAVNHPKGAVHINLDHAWREIDLPVVDASDWGPVLRFSAPGETIERFFVAIESRLAQFILYGSGDFHHLSALWLRHIAEPVTLVSLDNHPDWDVRPPRWGCGGWINRALELDRVRHVAVWGCGNFECWWPHQFFGNRKAERLGRLEVHPWADHRPAKDRNRLGAILRGNWRAQFEKFARELSGSAVYVTIDLDCLAPQLSWTNWENGKFTLDDACWALQTLRQHARIVGGDMCGAYSLPVYARRKQRFASRADHPYISLPASREVQAINKAAYTALWPALTK